MVEAGHVRQLGTPSLKQHRCLAEEIILAASVILYCSLSFHERGGMVCGTQRIYRKQCPAVRVKKSKDVPFEEDSYAESRPSTSIQLSDLTTRRRSVALKISDTKDNVPAMRRATRSEGYPSDANDLWNNFVTLSIAPHISQLLKQGELDFTHSLRSSRPVQYNEDRLNVFIPKVPHESTTELAEHMGYIPDTVARPFTLLKKHK
ncbi:hypothetical protein T01_6903 [Trichinella spiralis]|uniref:Uncharacterized protein n=1 Tax=Trichinella spiralis TaxID=6334 RepID=A0A0V1BNU1_TRISP|nr:hypothetical protein T01_6903 [Trichinella spiralis]